MSKHGGERHEDILNRIRWEAVLAFRRRHPDADFGLLCDEHLMTAHVAREGRAGRKRSGSRIPDVMFLHKVAGNDRLLMVEVGRCDFAKWPEFNMLHISFDLVVTYVERHVDVAASLFAEALEDYFRKAKEEK